MHKLFAPFEFLSSAFPLGKNWKNYYNREYSVPWEVVDENNQIIIDEVKTTQDNGFIGLWLPKDINATLRVEYDGLVVELPISTYSQSDTCITTPLKLEPIKF